MGSGVHGQNRTYGVFAVIADTPEDGQIVHIWRTRTVNLRKVLGNYRRSNGIATPLFVDGASTEIYLLETMEADLATVYRHIVAWTRHFLEQDYDVLTYPATYEAAYDLKPETDAIYQKISEISIPELLKQPYRHIKKKLLVQAEKTEIEQQTARLSIRLTPAEYNQFGRISRQHNLTYREALLAMMTGFGGGELSSRLIQRQKEQIKRQQEGLKNAQSSRMIQTDERRKKALEFCQQGVRRYIDLVCDKPACRPECLSWNQAVRAYPERKLYLYPTEDGFFLFSLEWMCYGKGARPAIFLYGTDLDRHKRVMLRFYAKPEYCGVQPPHSGYFVKGMQFLVGCKTADSGAVDLMAAFPVMWKRGKSEEPSLDDVLNGAYRRCGL